MFLQRVHSRRVSGWSNRHPVITPPGIGWV